MILSLYPFVLCVYFHKILRLLTKVCIIRFGKAAGTGNTFYNQYKNVCKARTIFVIVGGLGYYFST